MEISTLDYVIRLIGRLGFILVLVGAYQLWRLPVLKQHTDQFFWIATFVCLSSLFYTIYAFHFLHGDHYVMSIVFNVAGTWLLAVHLNYRAIMIRRNVGDQKIHDYYDEINKRIEEIKKTSI